MSFDLSVGDLSLFKQSEETKAVLLWEPNDIKLPGCCCAAIAMGPSCFLALILELLFNHFSMLILQEKIVEKPSTVRYFCWVNFLLIYHADMVQRRT